MKIKNLLKNWDGKISFKQSMVLTTLCLACYTRLDLRVMDYLSGKDRYVRVIQVSQMQKPEEIMNYGIDINDPNSIKKEIFRLEKMLENCEGTK